MTDSQPLDNLLLLDYLPIGACVLDARLVVVFWNQRLQTWLGIDKSSIVGKRIDHFFPGFSSPEYVQGLQSVFQGGDEISLSLESHSPILPALLPDGRQRLLAAKISPVPLQGKYAALFTFQDVTEFIQTSDQNANNAMYTHHIEELARDKTIAENASRAKSAFLANMSHEIRTPMTAILGYAEIVSYDKGLSDASREYLSIIARSGEHLLNLLDDVLEMSRIEAGKIKFQPEAFDVRMMLSNVKNLFEARARQKHLSLIFDIEPSVPAYTVGDEAKLRQILLNLLSNAIKFTHDGGVTLRVNTCHFDGQFHLNFEVHDTGQGISPQEQTQLFQPFMQTRSGIRSQQGTGLGLAITYQFVQLMKGSIRCESTEGAGTAFFVSIPVQIAALSNIPVPPGQKPIVGLVSEPEVTYRILCADDLPENRLLLRRTLEPIGFELREARNMAELLSVCQTWQPHAILLDARFAGAASFESMRRIKAEAKETPPIIIMLSSDAPERQAIEAQVGGCDDIIVKPFKAATLLNCLGKHLQISYRYDDTTEPAPDQTEFPPDLRGLPREWIDQLQKAAQEIDPERAAAIIQQINAHNRPLGQLLDELIKNHRFDTLRKLVHEAR